MRQFISTLTVHMRGVSPDRSTEKAEPTGRVGPCADSDTHNGLLSNALTYGVTGDTRQVLTLTPSRGSRPVSWRLIGSVLSGLVPLLEREDWCCVTRSRPVIFGAQAEGGRWSNGVRNRMQNGATRPAAPYAKIGHSTDRKSVGSFFRVVTLPPVCPVAPLPTRHGPSPRHTSSKCRHGAARRISRPASTARSRRCPDRTPR